MRVRAPNSAAIACLGVTMTRPLFLLALPLLAALAAAGPAARLLCPRLAIGAATCALAIAGAAT